MKKVQFEFTDETYGAINSLAKATGVPSMSAVIRDALKIYAWLIDEQRAGNKLFSQNPETKATRELVPLTALTTSASVAERRAASSEG